MFYLKLIAVNIAYIDPLDQNKHDKDINGLWLLKNDLLQNNDLPTESSKLYHEITPINRLFY
jgi:hypothetical protein